MTTNPDGPIAIFYEHPDWFRPPFAELERRRVAYAPIDAAAHWFDPDSTDIPYSLVFGSEAHRAETSKALQCGLQRPLH